MSKCWYCVIVSMSLVPSGKTEMAKQIAKYLHKDNKKVGVVGVWACPFKHSICRASSD